MDTGDLRNWRKVATAKIRCKHDRDAVQREFRYHMQDKWEALRERGIPEKEIPQRILDDMGSAEELAPILAQIHKPYWGYALTILKWVMILLIVASLIAMGNTGGGTQFQTGSQWLEDTTTGNYHRIFYDEPNQSIPFDDYTLHIEKVALWTPISTEYGDDTALYLQIRVTQPPFMPKFNAWQYIEAEDSNGTKYFSTNDRSWVMADTNRVSFGGMRFGLFSDTGILVLRNLKRSEIEWIDLCYDRDGREITVRIDLTGGEGA